MFKKLINFGHSKLGLLDEHTLEVVKKSSASTVVKVTGMAIGLVVSVFLGRTIGADGLGIINLSFQIVQILMIVGLLGMPQVIIKEVAIARSQKNLVQIGNVMYTVYLLNGIITLLLSIMVIVAAPWISQNLFHEPKLTWPLIIAVIVMTPMVFSRLFSSGLIGYKKIWQSNLVNQTLSAAITGVLLLAMWLFKVSISVNSVAVAYAIGRIGVTISIGIYWRTIYNYKNQREFIGKLLFKTAKHLIIVSASTVLFNSLDMIFLGYFENSEQVGLYSVAKRLSLLTIFFLQITNSIISPKIAALYEAGRTKEIEIMVKRVTFGLMIIGTLFLLVFILLGKPILAVWGKQFVGAYIILIILTLGQLVNIGTGAVGVILVMTGNENVQKNISLSFLALNLILNIVLINYYGILGAAIAATITIVGINIAKIIYVNRKTRIRLFGS